MGHDNVKRDGLISPPIFVHSGVRAFFSTNSFITETDNIAALLNIPEDNVYFPVQKHSSDIYVLGSAPEPASADAVLTGRRGVLIGVRVADCVPVLLFDRGKNLVGAVHAGWRGTAGQILKNTIKTLQEEFHSSPGDILIALGPSIRKCCYDVGDEVKNAIERATEGDGYYYKKENKYFLDLSSANVLQALSSGVPRHNIWQSEECTYCSPEKFFSHRYSKGSAERQGGFIGML